MSLPTKRPGRIRLSPVTSGAPEGLVGTDRSGSLLRSNSLRSTIHCHGVFRFEAAFSTQLRELKRNRWHPRCVAHWKTITGEAINTVKEPDGTFYLDRNFHPIRGKQTVHLFDPTRRLQREEKATPPAVRKVAKHWLGVAAYDLEESGCSVLTRSKESNALAKECDSFTQAPQKKPHGQRMRSAVYELRNHERGSRKLLKSLDASLGRLDKKLALGLQTNRKLSDSKFFMNASKGAPTSKVGSSRSRRKPR